jgi:uncharacterized membrane protein
LVEHSLGKGEVISSILIIGSRNLSAGVEMHDAWPMLKWMWFAVFAVYGLLQIYASKRLHGQQKERSRNILIVMVVLVAIQFGIPRVLGSRGADRFTVFVDFAAGIAALVLITMLVDREPEGTVDASGAVDANGSKEQIQSLKLS